VTDVILVSNYSMKEELKEALESQGLNFYDLMIQDIHHIERYPIDDEYNTIIIQSANAIKKIDASNNHVYNAKYIYGIGPNCRGWIKRKFSLDCIIPDKDFSSAGLIQKIINDEFDLGKTLLLKGIGGKNTIENYLRSTGIDYKLCNVYERILNEDNLNKVIKMTEHHVIVLGFSRSSIEPLLLSNYDNLKKTHFIVLDKSDEEIIKVDEAASLTKLDDIYDIPDIIERIKEISE